MFEQRRYTREAWIPFAAGILWLWHAASFGAAGFVFSLIPGCLLLGSSVALLAFPGDVRIAQFTALGGFLGVPLAVPAIFVSSPLIGLALIALSAASFVAAGWMSIIQEPHSEDVPEIVPSLRLAAAVAGDDLILSSVTLTLPWPPADAARRVCEEVRSARAMFEERGWLDKPASYHVTPPALEDAKLETVNTRRFSFEKLRFDSGYEPHEGEPGRERWLGYEANREARAWVMRHPGEPRPWLVCIHGFQMGAPGVDLGAFRANRLHHKLGMNLIFPLLPLHGPRKIGRRSGDGFLAGDFLDTVHAEAQAMWDVRRLLSWVRAQGPGPIGVHGISLGGYNAALLASLDADLACVIAGIPLTDVSRAVWRHGPALQMRYLEHHGLVHNEVADVLRVISPLVLEPQVPHERRFLYAAVADRLVPPDQPRDLWRHWERPRSVWYPGAHLTFGLHPQVEKMVGDALREAQLVGNGALSASRH